MRVLPLLFLSGILACSTPGSKNIFTPAQARWLKSHRLFDHAAASSPEKQKQIADIVQTELDLIQDLDSIVKLTNEKFPEAKINH